MVKKIIIAAIILAIIITAISTLMAFNSVQPYKAQDFYIEKGDGARDIADRLQQKGVIRSPALFMAYAALTGNAGKFAPGDHRLDAGLDINGIIKELANPDNIIKETTIRIVEGWSIEDIGGYLEEKGIASKDEFESAADIDSWRDKYEFLNDKNIKSIEGFLFPDTYRIFVGSSAQMIIAKMLDNFQAKITQQAISDAKDKNITLYEAVTMASIIEKEAKFADDKKMISDIFWKRINAGMGLQSDATINYITGSGKTRSSGSDLEIDSPYNTYKYRGLPPGPISNPGLDSIMAAIYPTQNDYYYFITDSSGRAVFAKTYQEHQANIAKYLD